MTRPHDHSKELTPDQEAEIAREALEEGDLKHAAHHITGALVGEPGKTEWTGLLEQILEKSPQPLSLFPVPPGGKVYFGTVAMRAFALMRLGRAVEALKEILPVIHSAPQAGFVTWALPWARQPGVVEKLGETVVVSFLGGLLQAFPGNVIEEGEPRNLLERQAPLIEALCARYSNSAFVIFVRSAMLRKLGRLDEALAEAQRGCRVTPGGQTALALALAFRALNRIDQARDAYMTSLRHDPSNMSARLELGDMLCEAGRIEEGLASYEEVLRKEPDHPWARPWSLSWRWRLTGEQRWMDELRKFARAHPENGEAARLARGGTAFVGYLPDPPEATVDALRQIWEIPPGKRPRAGSKVSLELSCLESPSSRLALEILLQGPVPVKIKKVQSPDPRLPICDLESPLWAYQGTDPEPKVSPPDPSIAHAVARIARTSFEISAWKRYAASLAAELGPSGANDLLATMVHPPTGPDDLPLWTWIYRIQVAAALVIGKLDAGWNNTTRRKILLSILCGPMDWSVGAASIALTEIALDEPDTAKDIMSYLMERFHAVPVEGGCCYAYPVICCLLRLPSLPDDWKRGLMENKAELER